MAPTMHVDAREMSPLRDSPCRVAVQGGQDAMPQDLILPVTSLGRARRALLHLTADNDLLRVELISGKVDVAPAG